MMPTGHERHQFGTLLWCQHCGDLGEGFSYVKTNRAVGGLVLLALILYVFGMPYQQVFVPLVAFLLLVFVWVVATITKIDICVRIGVHLCK